MARQYRVNHEAIDRDYPLPDQPVGDDDAESDSPGRASRTYHSVGSGVSRVQGSDPSTGLGDPKLALWLYVAILSVAVMFSKKWGQLVPAITAGFIKK